MPDNASNRNNGSNRTSTRPRLKTSDEIHARSREAEKAMREKAESVAEKTESSSAARGTSEVDSGEFEPLLTTETEAQEKPIGMGPMAQQVKQRGIFKENPNVIYMNAESLNRPLDLPPDARKWRWIFVAVAAVIACIFLYFYFDYITNEPIRAQEHLQRVLSNKVRLEEPNLLELLSLSDSQIKEKLEKTAKKEGYVLIDKTSKDEELTNLDLLKLPKGMKKKKALSLYDKGMSKLSAAEAASLLYGSWELDVDRTGNLNMSLHYADFTSGSESTAIAGAIATQDLNRGTTSDSGEDDGYGNSYSSGSIMVKSVQYSWTVSATSLKSVYPISGLSNSAVYVGIRIIQQ